MTRWVGRGSQILTRTLIVGSTHLLGVYFAVLIITRADIYHGVFRMNTGGALAPTILGQSITVTALKHPQFWDNLLLSAPTIQNFKSPKYATANGMITKICTSTI